MLYKPGDLVYLVAVNNSNEIRERMETFAERLRAELDARPTIKRADLAAAAGVSQQAVSGWLSGKFAVNEDSARKIAALLGCSWIWLLHGEKDDVSEDRFTALPPAAREWLDRQARIVAEFEERHPLLAGLMFSEPDDNGTFESAEQLLRALDTRAQVATMSGTLALDKERKVLGCDAIAFRILTKLSAALNGSKLPATASAMRGRNLESMLPKELAEQTDSLMRQAERTMKEAGQIIHFGEAVTLALAFPTEVGIVALSYVDLSDKIEFE